MMSSPAKNPQEVSGIASFFLMILFLCAIVFVLWSTFRPQIMWISFYLSYYLFSAYTHLSFLMTSSELAEIKQAIKIIPSIKPNAHGWDSLMTLWTYHGYIGRSFFIPLMLWWGWRAKKNIVRFRYRNPVKDVYDLIDRQAPFFPASAIIKDKNLLEKHPYIGPWATYAMPLDFALDNRFLWVRSDRAEIKEDAVFDERQMRPWPPFKPDTKLQNFPYKRRIMPHHRFVIFNFAQANKVFSHQLGAVWRGVDALTKHEKGLFAAFCAQACSDQKEACNLLDQMAFSFREGQRDEKQQLLTEHVIDISGADNLIKKYGQHPLVVKACQNHGHTYNVLFELLRLARIKGRLLHSHFLWLKPTNRTLWYCLAANGGQCPYLEASGVWAHYEVEKILGKAILEPMVLGAVFSMYDLMAKEHWIDPGKYSEANQRKRVEEANDKLKHAQGGNKSDAHQKQDLLDKQKAFEKAKQEQQKAREKFQKRSSNLDDGEP